MHPTIALILTSLLPLSSSAETVLGVYIFSRHGDRTSKSTPPTNLTTLGYSQIFTSGSYFRSRYVADDASSRIFGLSPDIVDYKQISASARLDTVRMPSTQGFLQGLYPPVGSELGTQRLRNGSQIQAPLNGYQLIPIDTVTTGNASEPNAWLLGADKCAKAIKSSKEYFSSARYNELLNESRDFYRSLAPVVNNTFSEDFLSYRNAYAIYDLINVAHIHNRTIPSSHLLTPTTLARLQTYADSSEFALAYNTSSPVRAIAGATLAAQIVQALNTTLVSPSHTPKMHIQLGGYASFLSFFGLVGLSHDDTTFQSIPDYASTMTFELVTNATLSQDGQFPRAEDVSVRFLYHNGTPGVTDEPAAYALFNQTALTLPWGDFVVRMGDVAVGDQAAWCEACGNSTGVCKAPRCSNRRREVTVAILGAVAMLFAVFFIAGLVMLVVGFRIIAREKRGDGNGGEKNSVRSAEDVSMDGDSVTVVGDLKGEKTG